MICSMPQHLSSERNMSALKGLDMAAPTSLCKSNLSPGRWEWRCSLTFSALVCSCCLLPSLLSECATIPTGYVWNSGPEFANITGPTTYMKGVFSTHLVTSPNTGNALALTIETSSTSGPMCYLKVIFSSSLNASVPTPRSGYMVTPWTHPCPHTPLPNGNCTFAFTKNGDIQLTNSVAGRSVLLWSSDTTDLGATALGMEDFATIDGSGGDLMLYNASSNIVWANVRDDTDFQCDEEVVITSQAATRKKISDYMLMCLVLSVGAALISFWGLRTANSGALSCTKAAVAAHKVLTVMILGHGHVAAASKVPSSVRCNQSYDN